MPRKQIHKEDVVLAINDVRSMHASLSQAQALEQLPGFVNTLECLQYLLENTNAQPQAAEK